MRSTNSRCTSRPGPSTGSSVPTAPARPRPSGSCLACFARGAARSACSGNRFRRTCRPFSRAPGTCRSGLTCTRTSRCGKRCATTRGSIRRSTRRTPKRCSGPLPCPGIASCRGSPRAQWASCTCCWCWPSDPTCWCSTNPPTAWTRWCGATCSRRCWDSAPRATRPSSSPATWCTSSSGSATGWACSTPASSWRKCRCRSSRTASSASAWPAPRPPPRRARRSCCSAAKRSRRRRRGSSAGGNPR